MKRLCYFIAILFFCQLGSAHPKEEDPSTALEIANFHQIHLGEFFFLLWNHLATDVTCEFPAKSSLPFHFYLDPDISPLGQYKYLASLEVKREFYLRLDQESGEIIYSTDLLHWNNLDEFDWDFFLVIKLQKEIFIKNPPENTSEGEFWN